MGQAVVDAIASASANSGTSPLNFNNQTVGSGSNRALLVFLAFTGSGTAPSALTVTWDQGGTNQTMNQIVALNDLTANSCQSYLYGLLNPTSGNKTLRITWTGGGTCVVDSMSFTNVNQSSIAAAFPWTGTNTGNSTTATITLNSGVNNICVAMGDVQFNNTTFASHNGTLIFDNQNTFNDVSAEYMGGQASQTLTFGLGVTAFPWGMIACDVQAAPSNQWQQGNTNQYVASAPALSFSNPVGNGNCVLGMITYDSTATLTSVTDDKSNTYHISDTATNGTDTVSTGQFYLANITNAPQTITCNLSGGANCSVIIDEFSGVQNLTDPRDGHSIRASGTSNASAVTNATTTTVNGDLIYAAAASTAAGSAHITGAAGTGTILENYTAGSQPPYSVASQWQIQSTAGSITPSYTCSATSRWNSGVMAIKMTQAAPSAAPLGILGMAACEA